MGNGILEEKKLHLNSIIGVIERHKGCADWTAHEYSRSFAGEIKDISDKEISDVLNKIKSREPIINFTISDIRWENYGNCVGDELYPVTCDMVLLPDNRYYIAIKGYGIFKEYVYNF